MSVNPKEFLATAKPEDLDSGPVVVLNMLKLKSKDRLEQLLKYGAGVLGGWGDQGVEVIYAGAMKERINGDMGDWDYVMLVQYPNRRVLCDMMSSEAYEAIHIDREEALSAGVLWPSEPVMSYRSPSKEFSGGEWETIFASMMNQADPEPR